MCKFIPLDNGDLLNINEVSRFIRAEDGYSCIVLTRDGQHFSSYFNMCNVDIFDSACDIVPCNGISSIYLNTNGSTEIRPCAFVVLKENGDIEPIEFVTDEDLQEAVLQDDYGFQGFVPSQEAPSRGAKQ